MNIAQAIGLADNPPALHPGQSFITNTPVKRTRKRKCNYSDIFHIEREERAKKVRERSLSLHGSAQATASRKGSVKDVFINAIKPEEDPFKLLRTQKLIFRNNVSRTKKIAENNERVCLLSADKQKRSKILGRISQGVVTPRKPSPQQPK